MSALLLALHAGVRTKVESWFLIEVIVSKWKQKLFFQNTAYFCCNLLCISKCGAAL